LRFKLAFDPALTGRVLWHFVRAVSSWLRRRARRLGISAALRRSPTTSGSSPTAPVPITCRARWWTRSSSEGTRAR
jgi:hypothetical protein